MDEAEEFYMDEEQEEEAVVEPPELINCFEQLHDLLEEAGAKSDSSEFVPLSESLQNQQKKSGKLKKKKSNNIKDSVKVFSFDSLNTLIQLAHLVSPQYTARNSIWKDPVKKRYYLLLNRGHGKSIFQSTCSMISEFGKEEVVTYATQAYYNEHFQMILKDKALEQLAKLS